MIEIDSKKPWVSGKDTTRDFPELRSLLDSDYVVTQEGAGYRIYERGSWQKGSIAGQGGG